MALLRRIWQRFTTWRSTAGSNRPVEETVIKKVAIDDEHLSDRQRGLGRSEGSMGSG